MSVKHKTIKELYSESVEALRNNHYQRAIEISDTILLSEPEHARAYAIQFSGLFKDQQFERARQVGTKAAALNPESLFILNNQACLQLDAKQPAAAAGLLRSLISQFGERAQWLYNLALAQRMVGNYDNAIAVFQQTLRNDPQHDRAAFQLAECFQQVGDLDEASNASDYVRMLRTKHAPSHSQSIEAALRCNGITSESLAQELRLWTDLYIPQNNKYPVLDFDPNTSLKIGFVLGDIPSTWLQRIVLPLINQLANSDDQVHVYQQSAINPARTFDEPIGTTSCGDLSDSAFARKVRDDKIDVLIDLCGMRVGNRQRALGLGLCKAQFSWLVHQGSLPGNRVSMIEDKFGSKKYAFTESPRNSKKALPENTFAAISTDNGVSSRVIGVWANILKTLPDWKMHLDCVSPHIQKSLRRRFKAFNIEAEKLLFDANLQAQQDNIVLDNFDFNDPVASYDVIQRQACLVVMRGTHFPAQHSSRIFEQIGFENLVLNSPREYLDHAVALASGVKEPITASEKRLRKAEIQDFQQFTKSFRHIISH